MMMIMTSSNNRMVVVVGLTLRAYKDIWCPCVHCVAILRVSLFHSFSSEKWRGGRSVRACVCLCVCAYAISNGARASPGFYSVGGRLPWRSLSFYPRPCNFLFVCFPLLLVGECPVKEEYLKKKKKKAVLGHSPPLFFFYRACFCVCSHFSVCLSLFFSLSLSLSCVRIRRAIT